MGWATPGVRAVWLRHGVVEVARLTTLADDPYIVVEPVGWKGEAGWIAQHATGIQLRRLSSPETCERWLAQLRDPPKQQPAGDLQTRIVRRFNTIEFGTAEQLVVALAESYAELYKPDNEDLRLLDRLEALVMVEIACVLGHDIESLRVELREQPRFAADAPSSGEIGVRERNAAKANDPEVKWFASFECNGTLHVTDLDECSVRVDAMKGPWRATMLDESRWIAIARERESALPLDARSATHITSSDGETYPFAILDGTALEDDAAIEDELFCCLSNDVRGRGAAVFARRACSVLAWMKDGACWALRVDIKSDTSEDPEE